MQDCLSLDDFWSTFTTVKDSRGIDLLDPHDARHMRMLRAAWREAGPQRIWTWVDTPGFAGSAILPGVRIVNRLAYVITREAWACEELEFWSPDEVEA